MKTSIKTALITGGNGNLGRLVAKRLLADGVRVIKFDIPGTVSENTESNETVVMGDMRDDAQLESILIQHQPDTIYHLASLLSGSSEADHEAAWAINASASFKLLELAVKYKVRTFFFAGTTASYGGALQDPLPETTEQWPENIYGVTKVAVERLGVFYKKKNNLDFRILRFPMVISPFAPATAVTAFPSHAFKAAIEGNSIVLPISPELGMSTLFLDDVVDSIVDYCYAPRSNLTQHAYNLHSYFLSAEMVVNAILERYANFKYQYQPDETVNSLFSMWPNVVVDEAARKDWGWQPKYDFPKTVDRMFELIS